MERYGAAVGSTPKPPPGDEPSADQPGTDRMRGPKRNGNRTTLRVPTDLFAAAREYAESLGTTPTDALVFAERGADLHRPSVRSNAQPPSGVPPSSPSPTSIPATSSPPPDIVERAILSLRKGE